MRQMMPAFFPCLAAILLLSGCTASGRQDADPGMLGNSGEKAVAEPPAKAMRLPPSPQYTASYAISDGSAELSKSVWRKSNELRVQYSSSGKIFLDFFFLSGKAYTCTTWKQQPDCFEIGTLEGELGRMFESPDFSSAEPDEAVDIGGTKGACYLFPYTVGAQRKMCFTDRGVVAYDEYPSAAGRKTVEYLTGLKYSADEAYFALPAQPQAAPKNVTQG